MTVSGLTTPIAIVPAHEIPLTEQAQVFTEAFAGYVGGSFALDAAGLARIVCTLGADLCYSRFARDAEGLCGFGYIGRTGNVSRLAGMAVIARARRTGVARGIMRALLEEARKRGDRAMVLEVIEQNPAAVELYRSQDFRELTRLSGWRRAAGTAGENVARAITVEEISPLRASQLATALDYPELPWQISRYAVAKLTAPRAFTAGPALVVLDDADPLQPLRAVALNCTGPEMDWLALRAAFTAVVRRYREREIVASAIFPESFGENVFAPLGFRREAISQYLMRHEL